jgi:SAM-dependent methyltransferase
MDNTSFSPDSYWEDRLHKIKGLEGVGFKKLGPSFNKWAYRVRKKVFLKQVKMLPATIASANVLDIGSGTGFYIQNWRELQAANITGVDIAPTSVANLKQTFPNSHFFQSDIGDPAFNKTGQYATYDLVSAMDVLFHIVDDERFEQAIANIASIIKPGGYFIYSDMFLHGLPRRGESQVLRPEPYLMQLFARNGFEPVIRKPFMYFTDNPVDAKNPLMKAYWFLLENGLYILPFMGHVLGPLIYPFEMLAVNNSKTSPTTEFTIFRKK